MNWEVIGWTCITMAVVMGVIAIILNLISARSMKQKRKAVGEIHTEMKIGSRIMFAGGIYGTVTGMDEETLRVEVAPKTIITISRYAVQALVKD